MGLCDGVSGLFSSPQKTCRGAPAPLAVRNGRCVANGRACCLCGFYATASLGLFPCPSRLAGARRRPSQFAMVVASLMGGLVAFVGFMRRRPWACSLAPVDLQGRAGAPAPPAWGGCPRTPQSLPRLILPPFAPARLAPPTFPGPAPPPVVLPAAVRAIFLYRRPRFLRFLPSAPLASSPNVKNGPQSRSFPFLPRRATPHGPPWDLRRWFWRRPSAPPRPPCSPWPPAGGRRDASRPPSPGLRPGLPVWRRGPRPRQPNAAPPAQRPCSPLPPVFRAYYHAFVCILAHVPYRCPYRAN